MHPALCGPPRRLIDIRGALCTTGRTRPMLLDMHDAFWDSRSNISGPLDAPDFVPFGAHAAVDDGPDRIVVGVISRGL